MSYRIIYTRKNVLCYSYIAVGRWPLAIFVPLSCVLIDTPKDTPSRMLITCRKRYYHYHYHWIFSTCCTRFTIDFNRDNLLRVYGCPHAYMDTGEGWLFCIHVWFRIFNLVRGFPRRNFHTKHVIRLKQNEQKKNWIIILTRKLYGTFLRNTHPFIHTLYTVVVTEYTCVLYARGQIMYKSETLCFFF